MPPRLRAWIKQLVVIPTQRTQVLFYCDIGHNGQVSEDDGRESHMQPKVTYEQDWELARQRAEAANVSVGEWLNGVATYDEKRKRNLAEFRASCHRSLERAKTVKELPSIQTHFSKMRSTGPKSETTPTFR